MTKRALFVLAVLAASSPALAAGRTRAQRVDALIREVGHQVQSGHVPEGPITVARTYNAGLLTGEAFVEAVRGTKRVPNINMNARTNEVADPGEATDFLINHVQSLPSNAINHFSIAQAISEIAKAKIELGLASNEPFAWRASLLRRSAAARLSVFRGKVRGTYTEPEISIGVAALREGLFSAEVYPDAPMYLPDGPARGGTRSQLGVEALVSKITRQMSTGEVPPAPISIAATDENRIVMASDFVDAVGQMRSVPAINLRAKGITVGTPKAAMDLLAAYVRATPSFSNRYTLGQIGDRLADIAKAKVELAAAAAETGNPARQATLRESAALRLAQFPAKLLLDKTYLGTPAPIRQVRAELFPHPIFPDYF